LPSRTKKILASRGPSAHAKVPGLPDKERPAFLPVGLCEPYLRLMEKPGYDPFKTVVELRQWKAMESLARFPPMGIAPVFLVPLPPNRARGGQANGPCLTRHRDRLSGFAGQIVQNVSTSVRP
jgi:hypothetical protein